MTENTVGRRALAVWLRCRRWPNQGAGFQCWPLRFQAASTGLQPPAVAPAFRAASPNCDGSSARTRRMWWRASPRTCVSTPLFSRQERDTSVANGCDSEESNAAPSVAFMRSTDVMQNKPTRPKSTASSFSSKEPTPGHIFDDQDEDEPEDRSLAAFESLLAAQQRMNGIVECAGALNRLLAEAADGSSMPLNLPPLPPAFLAAAAAVRAQEERAMNLKTMSHIAPAGSSSDPHEIPAAGYGRLEALIRMRGFITNSDMREAFEMSPIQATMRLKDLVAQRVLVQRGQRRGARYSTGPRWPPKT